MLSFASVRNLALPRKGECRASRAVLVRPDDEPMRLFFWYTPNAEARVKKRKRPSLTSDDPLIVTI